MGKNTVEKIGLGIVTYNREEYFSKTFKTVPYHKLDAVVVVNDGTPYNEHTYGRNLDLTGKSKNYNLIQHATNLGVSKAKNSALKFLLDSGCDHIFLMEDDIFINNENVFEAYIKASKDTKIQHLNYALHGFANKTQDNVAQPKCIIDIHDTKIALYHNCVGAFSYYSRKCLETVGLIDENFYNAFDHVDHTYQIIKSGMHPDFWWFADIVNSDQYLSDIPWSKEKSTISGNPNHNLVMKDALQYFEEKNGVGIFYIENKPVNKVAETLKAIYKNG